MEYRKRGTCLQLNGTDWDINPGLVTLGEHKPFAAKLKVFYHLKVIHQKKHIEVWFGDKKDKMEKIIEADDDKFKSGLFGFDGYNQPIHFDNVRINGPGIPLSPGEAAVHNPYYVAFKMDEDYYSYQDFPPEVKWKIDKILENLDE